jgi:DNA invertase Pin-like site-specific DNA recombinase
VKVNLSKPIEFWFRSGKSAPKESTMMNMAAIYARVSSTSQKQEETIASQTSELKEYAKSLALVVPVDWVFEDEGFSGSTLVRPELERLRDLVAQVHVDIVLCHAPDRLARRYAYQVLLLEEFARAGTAVRFLKATPPDTPEAALLVQVQGIIAEYEKAQILERTRRGKLHRARMGWVNVLSGAPFGYRYVRKGPDTPARYEIVEHEARIVRELFRRYTEEPLSLRKLGKWLTEQGIPTAAGKSMWDHSTVPSVVAQSGLLWPGGVWSHRTDGPSAAHDTLAPVERCQTRQTSSSADDSSGKMDPYCRSGHRVGRTIRVGRASAGGQPPFLRTANQAAVSIARINCVPTLRPCLLPRPQKVSRRRQLRLLSLRRQQLQTQTRTSLPESSSPSGPPGRAGLGAYRATDVGARSDPP